MTDDKRSNLITIPPYCRVESDNDVSIFLLHSKRWIWPITFTFGLCRNINQSINQSDGHPSIISTTFVSRLDFQVPIYVFFCHGKKKTFSLKGYHARFNFNVYMHYTHILFDFAIYIYIILYYSEE